MPHSGIASYAGLFIARNAPASFVAVCFASRTILLTRTSKFKTKLRCSMKKYHGRTATLIPLAWHEDIDVLPSEKSDDTENAADKADCGATKGDSIMDPTRPSRVVMFHKLITFLRDTFEWRLRH